MIRPASAADAAGIAEVHVRSWQAAYAGQLPDDVLRGLSVSDRRRFWERLLSDPDQPGRVLVLDISGTVGGFASVGPCRDEDADEHVGELSALYLHSRYWDRGLGRRLHDAAMATLGGDGYQRTTLWVLGTNTRARRFYEKAGWVLDSATKIDRLGEVVFEDVRYAKPLTPDR